ncbi:MAG: Ig-like domain-containing protein [Acidobacteria bacterium]|nr:Ig-like domain-containing protein [Acidobacteriota bacterium]
MRRIVTFGLLALAVPMLAVGQTKDDFAYWDRNANGDLTCSEALGRDEGLRLPAYRDDRDGTGIIYQWLERTRSSDSDNDGIGCDSESNPNGYIPRQQTLVEPEGCPADAEVWRGLQVCEEQPRTGYDRDAFGSAYRSLEDDIIRALPATMRSNGQVYTPYSCIAFDIEPDGIAATDVEHIVALAEAHDSRIADDRRRDIAADLLNLTIADPTVNRSQKSDRDAAQWVPARHGRWFAEQVIAVKLAYGLSVDPAERAALEALLAGPHAELNCLDADTTSPTVAISSDAVAPVTGPFAIVVTFSEPVTGFALEDVVVGNGSASQLRGSGASYAGTITPVASGLVTVDIAAGAAEDGAGNPSIVADRFMIAADFTAGNRPPMTAGTLPDRRLAPDDTVNVDVSRAFVDPDGDALSFTASSSVPQVVTASVTGAFVMLAALSEGAATIRVTATDPGGLSVTQSFRVSVEVAVSEPFTDHPLRLGVTPVKAIHFTELRTRIDALRRTAGLLRFSWTDPALRAGGTRVRRVHLLELRSALAEAYQAAGRATPRWTDASPAAGTTPIRALHVTELRAAVLALE